MTNNSPGVDLNTFLDTTGGIKAEVVNLLDEVSISRSVESSLSATLNYIINDAPSHLDTLKEISEYISTIQISDGILNETVRSIESVLLKSVSSEASLARGAESALSTAVLVEASTARGAESALLNTISFLAPKLLQSINSIS